MTIKRYKKIAIHKIDHNLFVDTLEVHSITQISFARNQNENNGSIQRIIQRVFLKTAVFWWIALCTSNLVATKSGSTKLFDDSSLCSQYHTLPLCSIRIWDSCRFSPGRQYTVCKYCYLWCFKVYHYATVLDFRYIHCTDRIAFDLLLSKEASQWIRSLTK